VPACGAETTEGGELHPLVTQRHAVYDGSGLISHDQLHITNARWRENELQIFNQKPAVVFVETHVQERLIFDCRFVSLGANCASTHEQQQRERDCASFDHCLISFSLV
jgi:hypothetical protein